LDFVFLWLTSQVGKVFGHFGSGYLALGPTARWKYFHQVFIGN